jgi:hypothetical protein
MQNTTHCFNDNKQYLVTPYSTTRIQRSKRAMKILSKNHNERKPITKIKKSCKTLFKQLSYTKRAGI